LVIDDLTPGGYDFSGFRQPPQSTPNQGASQNIALGAKSGANNYAVQSLWSNAFNGGAGGCVITYR
jgi:hypothetical protein